MEEKDMDEGVRVTRDFGGVVYHYKGRKYDEASAIHNGIIGMGSTLKKMILSANEPKDDE